MRTTIVLRAGNPARAAAIARAIGVPLLDPDRLNPDCWYVRTSVTILVTGDDGSRGISFGPDCVDRARVDLEKIVGSNDIRESADGRFVSIEMDGYELRMEHNVPRMLLRDIVDIGSLFSIKPVFDDNRDEILEALRGIGASDPRLVGPALGRTGGSRRWTLVVDAPVDADIASVERLIADIGRGFAPLVVRRSASFEGDHLAAINRYAYDV